MTAGEASGAVSTRRVDYLQRTGSAPRVVPAPATAGDSGTRRLLRVRGIGLRDKERLPARLARQDWRPPTAELVTGLYGYRIPLAYYLVGSPAGVEVHLGTWSAKAGSGAVQDRRADVVDSVLRGLYPVVDLAAVPDQSWSWPLSGLALGVPAPAGVDEADGAAPVDRVIRSMAGTDWAVLVLAYPVAESAVGDYRDALLNEVRAVESAARNEGGPSPLTEQYVGLLTTALSAAGDALATGGWRTAVYLLGDGTSYPRLASAWRSVMSGPRSLPEPVRVFDLPEADALAQAWALPDAPGEPGPGQYRRPFETQTLLSTAQLAAYVHLPELETPGFSVSMAPRFDTVARESDGGVAIGQVLHNGAETAGAYRVPLASLTRHAFVAGLTGSGKTNTILSLLHEADAAGVPFLVVEPAKREYRALLESPRFRGRVRVFTAGQAMVSPLVLNPFEVPPGTGVSEHLDLLRAAFTAAFGMWTPLPQILERCLHEVYADRGWDLRTGTNRRAATPADDAFPTLADLVAKAGEVIPSLGYEDKIAGDLRAALVTRLESLRRGGKGAMLDVTRSLPIAELLAGPTVVELEPMGDDGDKAFVLGMLLVRLAEHRRAIGARPGLEHLLVVEEAHRLLGNVPSHVAEEAANPRGQAVETFANLLSEIRAYGQGVVIADQVPVRLAPDALKNTDLKIAHRTVSGDDRTVLAAAMAMDERQAKALTALGPGEAVVFGGGDDAPLLVRVPLVKDPLATPPTDAAVAEAMAQWRRKSGYDALFRPRPFCAETCADEAACDAARALAADPYVQRVLSRLVLSTIEEPGALDRLWPDLLAAARARRPVSVAEPALLRALAGHGADWWARRRGAQEAWPYADTAAAADALRAVLLDRVEGGGRASRKKREALRALALRLGARTVAPYDGCGVVCAQDPPVCLYRSAVADVVASGRLRASWRAADEADATDEEGRRRQTWDVCQDAAYDVVEFPDADGAPAVNAVLELAARRVCVCFAQQMLAEDTRKAPRTARRVLSRVVAESGL